MSMLVEWSVGLTLCSEVAPSMRCLLPSKSVGRGLPSDPASDAAVSPEASALHKQMLNKDAFWASYKVYTLRFWAKLT